MIIFLRSIRSFSSESWLSESYFSRDLIFYLRVSTRLNSNLKSNSQLNLLLVSEFDIFLFKNWIIFYFSSWYSSGLSHLFNISSKFLTNAKNLSFSACPFLIKSFTSPALLYSTFLQSLASITSLNSQFNTAEAFWYRRWVVCFRPESKIVFWSGLFAFLHALHYEPLPVGSVKPIPGSSDAVQR